MNFAAGTPYVQQSEWDSKGKRTYLRTGTSSEALAKLDCSEFVCRVMAFDGITNGIKSMTTLELKDFLANEDKFIRSKTEPKPGDIFLWRANGAGHTGIVVSYNPKTGMVVTTESRGTKYGTLKNMERSLDFYKNVAGWEGFFRPKNETADGKPIENNVNSSESTTTVSSEDLKVFLAAILSGGDLQKAKEQEDKAKWERFIKRAAEEINKWKEFRMSNDYFEFVNGRERKW